MKYINPFSERGLRWPRIRGCIGASGFRWLCLNCGLQCFEACCEKRFLFAILFRCLCFTIFLAKLRLTRRSLVFSGCAGKLVPCWFDRFGQIACKALLHTSESRNVIPGHLKLKKNFQTNVLALEGKDLLFLLAIPRFETITEAAFLPSNYFFSFYHAFQNHCILTSRSTLSGA